MLPHTRRKICFWKYMIFYLYITFYVWHEYDLIKMILILIHSYYQQSHKSITNHCTLFLHCCINLTSHFTWPLSIYNLVSLVEDWIYYVIISNVLVLFSAEMNIVDMFAWKKNCSTIFMIQVASWNSLHFVYSCKSE